MSMSSQPKRHYTLEEYLALERSSDARYEYWDGEIFLMSGGSFDHELIISNVQDSLRNQLRDRNCYVLGQGMQIKVPAAPPYRYADGSVVCGKREIEKFNSTDMLLNPVLIFEVLSPSTEGYDRGDKFRCYKSIPSFREYLLIAQDRPRIEHYVKQTLRRWDYEDVEGLESEIRLPTIECTLLLSDVYRGVDRLSQMG